MAGKLYFAYGSNINLDQMAQRCPEAEVVGPVTLPDHELLFRYSGVATIRPKRTVWSMDCCGAFRPEMSGLWITTRAFYPL